MISWSHIQLTLRQAQSTDSNVTFLLQTGDKITGKISYDVDPRRWDEDVVLLQDRNRDIIHHIDAKAIVMISVVS